MKTNKRLAALFIVIVLVTWGILAAFVCYLYKEGSKYPAELVGTDRMRDYMYAIYITVGAGLILPVIVFLSGKPIVNNNLSMLRLRKRKKQ